MSDALHDIGVVETATLFRPLLDELVRLLRGLSVTDWDRPTLAPRWRVRDVVAHLLDGDLRRLSLGRDAHALPSATIDSYRDLVHLINSLNASGVAYASRLSPLVMTDLLEVAGRWVAAFVDALPADRPARFPVAWAGQHESPNWMDTAREYTERWHHQMQIREAVHAPTLLETHWLKPLLDVSMLALPVAYRRVEAAPGTSVVFEVAAGERHVWSVVRVDEAWSVLAGRAADARAVVSTDADTAWKLLFNALSPDEAAVRLRIQGDNTLAAPLLNARSVMV